MKYSFLNLKKDESTSLLEVEIHLFDLLLTSSFLYNAFFKIQDPLIYSNFHIMKYISFISPFIQNILGLACMDYIPFKRR